ncbi:MAG: phosphoribosylformylglycinamidine cyclo-ligase [Lentisphaeria bacterium]|nr:phosphoribosylformylglycinamidine cyclo-ligase [Candidatus Neomarinimicrobiota bacterium]MCF7841999.1 phosphoribosylformylglycinamidine cyclo-ligase [Lentisphaeria bacterium]
MSLNYKSAGVNIDAGNEVVARIKDEVKATFSPAVLTGIGSFGSFFDLSDLLTGYKNPVLVQSIDGVGTKMIVARKLGKFDTIGHDLVSACVNDIIVHGARPLTFLDYIANDRLNPDIVAEIVGGMAKACRGIGVSLVGGETAEMPDTYRRGELDLVGVVTGVVDKDKIVNGAGICPGDKIIGVNSSGLHTNGYSLARKLFFDVGGYAAADFHPRLNETVGAALLKPHINYTGLVMGVLDAGIAVKGMAHITGGGLPENLPRILPENCQAVIRKSAWEVPEIFNTMQQIGEIPDHEMYRTFNMGIGLVFVVTPEFAQTLQTFIADNSDLRSFDLGSIQEGSPGVEFS